MNLPDLHSHSTFSSALAQGDALGMPKAVVERAVELGWGAACLSEHGWMGSAPTFYKACVENGIKPILGCELYICPSPEEREKNFHLTVLALSAEGYYNLVAWTTFANQRENFKYKPKITLEEMIERAPFPLHNNVILTGCMGGELAQSQTTLAKGDRRAAGVAYLDGLRSAFPHVYVEIQNHKHEKFIGRGFDAYELMVTTEAQIRARLVALSEITGLPLVVTNDSHFQSSSQRKAHIAMQAGGWRGREHGEHHASGDERQITAHVKNYTYWMNYMRSMEKVADGLPSSALSNIAEIVDEVDIRLDPLDRFSYSIPFSGYGDPISRIRKRAEKRLAKLEKRHGGKVRERFDHELEAMESFAHYLLMMSDFIIYARKQGILTNTRGSAANSLVCYCLRIHNIDPIEYKLTFSRFFNPARKRLPDIDIDIEHDRYGDFISYVLEYMAEREGDGQAVPICTHGTMANRSAFRMVAEASGVPKEKIDEIAKLLPQMIDSGVVESEDEAYEILKDEFPELHGLAAGIFDSIKSVGQHACGWVFGTKERPLSKWVPSLLIVSSNTQVSAYNLKAIEELGLVKGDFLRLKTLSAIKRNLQLIGKDTLDLEAIPLDDEETFEMLREGHTEGVFTLQGKANRQGCVEIGVEDVHDVIATTAIYRPALMRGDLNKTYIRRRRGHEEVDYPSEAAEEILEESFGLPIYQEQLMELAYKVGMTDAEVGDLYDAIKTSKGIGRGAKEIFDKVEPVFIERATNFMSEEEAHETWELYPASGGYGFNRGHATSYGILAVRSAYLRAHHPREFFTALLDVYPEKSRYIAAARGAGYRLAIPDVGLSHGGFSPGAKPNEILVGLSRVKGLGPAAVRAIVAGQPFASMADFTERIPRSAVKQPSREVLAALGAFRSLGVKDDRDDLLEFQTLGFITGKPKAFVGCKPRHVGSRNGSGDWTHLGYTTGVEYTEPRHSVSKMFWIPPLPKDFKPKLIEEKAGYMGKNVATLLLVVDTNGIPFHLIVNSDRPGNVEILKFLAKKCKGTVIVAEGSIRQPFLTDGPMGFRFYNIAGSFQSESQIFHADDRYRMALDELSRRKRSMA